MPPPPLYHCISPCFSIHSAIIRTIMHLESFPLKVHRYKNQLLNFEEQYLLLEKGKPGSEAIIAIISSNMTVM